MPHARHRRATSLLGAWRPAVGPAPLALLVCAALAGDATAQSGRIRSDLAEGSALRQAQSFRLTTTEPLAAAERLTLFVDETDVSALLTLDGGGWRYDAGALPLAAGEHELRVFVVSDSVWQEALVQRFRVLGRMAIERAGVKPTLELGLKSRLASAFEPAPQAGERATFNDLDGQLGLDAEVIRAGGARLAARFAILGTTERSRAVRYAELRDSAPKVDLASYRIDLSGGPLALGFGNVVTGSAKHLIQGFASRGATLAMAAGSRVHLSLAALHGSNVVGWDHLLGMTEPDHRVLSGTLGIEALSRPGALRLELSALNGSLLPRSGFGRSAVTDAERSRGYALRVQTSALGRLRLDANLTRSMFGNPADALLAGGSPLVDVDRETRFARSVDVALDVIRGLRIGSQTARLVLAYGHERVDPLFRSTAASVRADQLLNQWQIRGQLPGLTFSANHQRSHNNLDRIASILTTDAERTGFDVVLTLANVPGVPRATWLPTVRWRAQRTHQQGRGLPENGGFSATHVPDQVTAANTVNVDARLGRVQAGYRFERTDQNNRQVGRENADLEQRAHVAEASVALRQTLRLRLDGSRVSATAKERQETGLTRRLGVGLDWSPLPETALTGQLTDTREANRARSAIRDDLGWSLQWRSPIPGLQRFDATLIARYTRADNAAREPDAALDTRRSSGFFDLGTNLRFF